MTQGERRGFSKDNRRAKGALAEQAAASFLETQGYRIVERNWRCRSGEIDLIAEHSDTIVVVEVRSRSVTALSFGTPAESITPRKIRQVRETANVYLHQMHCEQRSVQFDVIAVMLAQGGAIASVEHIKNAF